MTGSEEGGGRGVDLEELAGLAEEAAARVLERYLGKRASNYFLLVSVNRAPDGRLSVSIEIEVLRGPPGVDLDAVVEEAVSAASREVERYVRAARRRGATGRV